MGKGFLEVVQARDISVGGLSVFVPHGFVGCDIETQVDLIVTLGRSRPFKARGVIRHRSQDTGRTFFGVQFTEIESEHVAAIESYIAHRMERLHASAR